MNLKTYLKTYSSINNLFIEDFFGLYKSDTTVNDFVINIDTVAKWLKSKKFTLKETLTKSYILGRDYKTNINHSTNVGRPIETVLLTPDCFKRLCMLSRTKKAEEVRSYFIELEAHLDKYKDYIIAGLTNKVAKYEAELKPVPEITTKGAIYVLKTSEDLDGIYKIGRTKNFADRLKVHQSSHPDKIKIAYVYETDNIEAIERCLKSVLKTKLYRNRREFYEIDLDSLKEVIKSCNCTTMLVANKDKTHKSSECNYIAHIVKASDKNEKMNNKLQQTLKHKPISKKSKTQKKSNS